MKNWKTTVGGILSAAGIGLAGGGSGTLHIVGTILASVGALLMGGAAKDSNVTGGTTQQ